MRLGCVILALYMLPLPRLAIAQQPQDNSVPNYKLTLTVRDKDSGKPVAARVYLKDVNGKPYYFSSTNDEGAAVRYEVQNWLNDHSTEYHTTVSAHPSVAEIPAGKFRLQVYRGKTWLPETRDIEIKDADIKVSVELQRWAHPDQLGWYSGDTHLHRTIAELQTVMLAENINVGLPLTNWVTRSDTAPTAGDKNLTEIPSGLIQLSPQHVIWPLNTEYEIFSVGEKSHTLGALFVLGHSEGLLSGVPPWSKAVEEANSQDDRILFDMDKLDWPFAMLLPTITPHALYELSNNHVWRTEFAFKDWNVAAPNFLNPPFGGSVGDHREWIDYTQGMYYSLLNAGFRLPPSAGTANGVHPVPAGFGRVYVYLPDGFRYADWIEGLQQGRSFVTTGPMLYCSVEGEQPGHVFKFARHDNDKEQVKLTYDVQAQHRLLYGEVLVNGQPVLLLRSSNNTNELGTFQEKGEVEVNLDQSGWIAIRWWETDPSGQARFAHSAPWYVEFDDEPVQISRQEKDYLVNRLRTERERSQGVVPAEALAEYDAAIDFYSKLPEQDDKALVSANSRELAESEKNQWLDNMIVDHRYSPYEVRLATSLSYEEIKDAFATRLATLDKPTNSDQVKLLPFPGGRHPRRGFLEGAIAPQRETKVSLFAPWKDGGYVVVDTPEAVFSNLGLTYLAHTHIPTVWDEAGIKLEPVEWKGDANQLTMTRPLPNEISFTSEVSRNDKGATMSIELTNGSDTELTGLRVQVCNMLAGLTGFENQDELEHRIDGPVVAIRARKSGRWVITGWTPSQRVWTNPPVPCIHADPIFPDCPPGETVKVKGELLFYEGADPSIQIRRLVERLTSLPTSDAK